jgi:UBX domain-containing protein 1/4
MKATKEAQDMKEELQRKEQIKEAAKKRQEKLEDLEAKKRIKAKASPEGRGDKSSQRRTSPGASGCRTRRGTRPEAACFGPQ